MQVVSKEEAIIALKKDCQQIYSNKNTVAQLEENRLDKAERKLRSERSVWCRPEISGTLG